MMSGARLWGQTISWQEFVSAVQRVGALELTALTEIIVGRDDAWAGANLLAAGADESVPS